MEVLLALFVFAIACDVADAYGGERLQRWADWVFQLKGRR